MSVEARTGPSRTIVELRAFLARPDVAEDGRLPPERTLAATFGVTRAELRKALAALEAEGQLWRHVGKGTFVGLKPIANAADVTRLAQGTNPAEMMRTRLALEPELARQAALHATPANLAEMHGCVRRMRQAATWRQYETFDTRFHRAVAEATQNSLLLGLFDILNAVRRTVTWGRLRVVPVKPAADHHSFAEHDAVVAAIEDRDMAKAADAMRSHLESVQRNLLERSSVNARP